MSHRYIASYHTFIVRDANRKFQYKYLAWLLTINFQETLYIFHSSTRQAHIWTLYPLAKFRRSRMAHAQYPVSTLSWDEMKIWYTWHSQKCFRSVISINMFAKAFWYSAHVFPSTTGTCPAGDRAINRRLHLAAQTVIPGFTCDSLILYETCRHYTNTRVSFYLTAPTINVDTTLTIKVVKRFSRAFSWDSVKWERYRLTQRCWAQEMWKSQVSVQ